MNETKEILKEKREYPRLKALYLLSYVKKDGDLQKSAVSMARTLDMSPAGAGLEVYHPIEKDSTVEIEVAIKEKVIILEGKVIHVQKTLNGNFFVGIRFNSIEEELIKELELV
jgi:hypothetical protein